MSQAFVILASASPRRAELLGQIGVPYVARAAQIDETPREGEAPRDYVVRVARAKAEAVAAVADGDRPVLGADTAVVVDGRLFGKPADEAQARRMLRALSARAHEVWSAVTVLAGARRHETVTCTRVHMRAIRDDEIERYWATGEPADKAGAYAIQGRGALFVEAIDGSYSGVVGLPLAQTAALLEAAGLSLWPGASAA